MFSGHVRGCIVDNDNMIVRIVLINDRLQVKLVPEVFGVIVRRHYYTERQLFRVLLCFVLVFYSYGLPPVQLLKSIKLSSRRIG